MREARLQAMSEVHRGRNSIYSSKGGRRQKPCRRSRRSRRGQRTPPALTVGNRVRLTLSLSALTAPSPLLPFPAPDSELTLATSTASLVLFARSPLGNHSDSRRPSRRLPLHLLLRPPPFAWEPHLQSPVRRSRQLEGRRRRCCRPNGERVGECGVGGERGGRGGEGKVSRLVESREGEVG